MFGGSLGLIPGNTVRVHDLGAVVAVQAADMVAQHSRSGGSSIGRRGRLDSRGAALGGRSAGFTSSWSNPGLYIGPTIHIHLLEARGAVPGALRGHGYACQILVPIGRRPVGGGGGSLKPRFQISTPVRPVASAEVWPLLDRIYRVDTNLNLAQRSKGWRAGGGAYPTCCQHS